MVEESSSLTWRPLTVEDAQAAADLLNAMEAVDRIGQLYTAQDTLQELIDPYLDLERATLGAFDGDVMAGYMKVSYKPATDDVHRVLVNGGVHPDHRRRGIGTELVEAGVAAAKALHARHSPATRLVIDLYRAEHIAGVAELFRSQGFAPAWYDQQMEHPLGDAIPETMVPDGLRVEPWTQQNDEEFRMIRNEAFKDAGLAETPVDSWKNWMINHTFQPEVSFLLRDMANGAPAGMLLTKCWEADTAVTGFRDATFFLIGTLRDYRRRGVASALIGHALRAAANQGYDRAVLRVDSATPSGAFGIYEKAGFVSKSRFVRWALES
ncbi:GNAT family N-acetyltransferase [Catenulispora subtropica]|uniref:N-acetyltransferase domain-containing protein n=1 Tax=Catenulispora subtropica TaxID=450798 RepID=A0ABP5DIK9_9ACTN